MLAIFQPEITDLEAQIAQLQAQIAHLNEVEFMAEGAIQALQSAVQKVSALAPSRIATLKSAVLELFTSGDGPDEGGNQPSPEPEPPGGEPEGCILEPDGEDISPVQDLEEPEEPAYIDLVQVTDSVAYMRRLDGEIVCCYLAFNNKAKAKAWAEWLTLTHSVATKCEARPSKRLTAFKYEVKFWGVSLPQIEKLATCNTTLDPRSCYPDAPKRLPEPTPPAKQQPIRIEELDPGDIVCSVTVPDWQYRVVEIKSDTLLDCERIGLKSTYRIGMKTSEVKLVSKAKEQEALDSIQPPMPAYDIAPIGRAGAAKNWETYQTMKAQGLGGARGTGTIPMAEWERIAAEQKAEKEKTSENIV